MGSSCGLWSERAFNITGRVNCDSDIGGTVNAKCRFSAPIMSTLVTEYLGAGSYGVILILPI